MSLFISDELFNLVVRHLWLDIVSFARGSFVEKGRGVLSIQKTRDAINVEDMKFEYSYTAYDDIAAEVDDNTARLICEYVPEKEHVVQYQRSDDDFHTVLVKIPSGENLRTMEDLFAGFSFENIFAEFDFSGTKKWYGMKSPKPIPIKDSQMRNNLKYSGNTANNSTEKLNGLENCYQQLLNLFRENGVDKIQDVLEQTIVDKTQILYTFDQAVNLLEDIQFRQDFENHLKDFRRALKTVSSPSTAKQYKALAGRFGKILKALKMREEFVLPDPADRNAR